jgi:hypothetical protein
VPPRLLPSNFGSCRSTPYFSTQVNVQPATVLLGARRDRPRGVATERRDEGRQGRIDARAANPAVQQSALREEDIAHDLGLQAAAALAGEQDVERVAFCEFGAQRGRLTIRRRRDDQPNHLLPAPTALAEFRGEVVEQLRMRWTFTQGAEIFGGRDDAPPKQILPDMVHRDARGEWILRIHQPTCEIKAIGLGVPRLARMNYRQRTRLHLGTRALIIAANVDVGFALGRRQNGGRGFRIRRLVA